MSITEVGAATGLKSSALRYYERAGLIAAEKRSGGRRHYDPSVLQRLAVIALLKEVGFTLAEIRHVMEGRSKTYWRPLAETKLQEIDAHLGRVAAARELLVAALSCGCSSLTDCDLVRARGGRHRNATASLLQLGPPRAGG